MVSDTEYYEGLWSYYQDFCKTHNATGITDLVVQRDNAIAKVAELEGKLAKYQNLEPVAYGWFEEGDMKALAFSDMPYTPKYSPDAVKKPLYALEK